MTSPIGILGGSFDPVHFGHLRLATECIQSIGLDKVLFVPLNLPAHRNPLVADASQRCDMVSKAIENNRQFELSDIEIQRSGVSYMIETLKTLRGTYEHQPLCLIMGMDAFVNFDTWKNWEDIPDLAHIIITNRPDSNPEIKNSRLKSLLDDRLAENNDALLSSSAGKIRIIAIPQLDISSSRIRNLVGENKSIDYLLPAPVIDYITTNRIYMDTTK